MGFPEHSWQQGQATHNYPFMTRLLLWAGAVGPLLFVAVLLIEGATRPGYNAWHTFGSNLSLGNQGWMQITNFIVCGILTLGFAIGLRQALLPQPQLEGLGALLPAHRPHYDRVIYYLSVARRHG